VLGLDAGTLIALCAMMVSLFGAAFKFIDRRRQINKEKTELNKKRAIADVERDSIVVRGAEGALLLMERTLKTANEECQRRIGELEEEISEFKCENSNLRQEVKDLQKENTEFKKQLQELNDRLRRIE
jgi:septal ring factor EnvC (AmiA/AmiB activator)